MLIVVMIFATHEICIFVSLDEINGIVIPKIWIFSMFCTIHDRTICNIYDHLIIPHVNSPYKTSVDERLIFYNITRCYSDGEYWHSFAIAAGDIVKYQSFVWCATAMRVRFVHVRIRSTAMADVRHDFGDFQLPITSLFMVRNIKCGYSFS